MDKLLEQFRYLNPKDPGTWPVLPKLLALIALLAALVAVGYVADWQAQMDELVAGAEEEVKLKEAYKSKKQLAVNLDLYRQQLREIDSSFGALLKQLPNKSQMDALLVDINQAGLGRGLQFDLFRPAPRETMKEFYAELPVSVRVTGSYHDMGQFASDIAQLSRIVTLNDISIRPVAGRNGSVLAMDTSAKTFRYLDEEEVAKQKRGAKKSAAGKKKK
ncbi:MAG: type 4a pilus biogenesis protein PilO [Burkholderiales bacterium]|jgi:type IV pilus assembly protein PilO|nr:type 4a pilus biogenesis protein PilO [Burkholderiales bacterium]